MFFPQADPVSYRRLQRLCLCVWPDGLREDLHYGWGQGTEESRDHPESFQCHV